MYHQNNIVCSKKRRSTVRSTMQEIGLNVKILVATHKPYWMPYDPIYLPVHVGAEGKTDGNGNPLDFGFVKDNTGDNISSKNANYCELTGLYWAWKNLDADYIGLAHYRRHFTVSRFRNKKRLPINGTELSPLLCKYDVILPKKRHYFIETNYSHYIHAHHKEDLNLTREIIMEKYPNYLISFDESMKMTSGHRFNMLIMRRDILNSYCKWLFDILFDLENRLDITTYNENDSRVFGFVSERLLDVWIVANDVAYMELPVVFLEDEKWIKKCISFVKRKFIGNK